MDHPKGTESFKDIQFKIEKVSMPMIASYIGRTRRQILITKIFVPYLF